MLPPAFVDVDGPLDSAVPVCNCHRRRNSLPGPGKFNTVHHSSPGHAAPVNSPSAPVPVQPVPQIIQAPAPPVVAQDVPEQYIVDQLHRLGAFYWHKPETTDCTIQVPMDPRRLSKTPNFNAPSSTFNTGVFASTPLDIRRGSEPVHNHGAGPKTLTNMKLHQFYLTAQSSLLRALFSGSSVIGLVSGQAAAMPSTSHFAFGRERQESIPSMTNAARIPRLLPSSAHHPTLFLPLPDPSSFSHIVHYMYFGSPAFLEEALLMGTIKWEGVVRNVEYLGLFEGDRGIRRWLAAWKHHQQHGYAMQTQTVFEESDEDTDLDSEEEEWSSSDDWDPMVNALAGMQMADPFALDLQSYRPPVQEQGPGPLDC